MGAQATQLWVNDNATVSLAGGAILYVPGDITLRAGSRLVNRGSVRFTGNWDASAGGQYEREVGFPDDSLIVLGTASVVNFQSTNDIFGTLSLASPSPNPVAFSGAARVERWLHFGQGRWETAPAAALTIGPQGEAVDANFLRYVIGGLITERDLSSPNGDRFYPIGRDTVYRPLSLLNTPQAGAGRIRAELFLGDAGAVETPGQRFRDLSTYKYYQLDLLSGSSNSALQAVQTRWQAAEGIPAARLPFLRQGIRLSNVSAGAYDTLTRSAGFPIGVALGGSMRSQLPTLGTAPSRSFLILGFNRLNAGVLATATPVVNVGDTARIAITSADAGADITRSITRTSVPAGTEPFGTVAGTATSFHSDTLFRASSFVSSVSAPGFEPDVTGPLNIALNTHVVLDLRVLLQGPYQQGIGNMSGGYTTPLLRSIFTTRSVADSNMYDTYTVPPTTIRTFNPPPGAVDVVALELRTGTAAATLVPNSRKLAWLMGDGSLRDFRTGSANHPVAYLNGGVPNGSYYVVVRHRNHLPLMSATAVAFNGGVGGNRATVDLRGINSVYSAVPGVRGGFFYAADGRMTAYMGNVGARAGEAFALVNSFDFFLTYIVANLALPGYLLEDINLDGLANMLDYQLVQRNNDRLYFSAVPE